MLTKQNKSLNDAIKGTFDWPWNASKPETFMWSHELSGSGGYSDYIFKYAAKHLFNEDITEISYKNLRNPDFKEAILEKDGKVVLRFAIANGFRNIQNLVQKLKRGKSNYDYVEVMACPSGKFIQPPLSSFCFEWHHQFNFIVISIITIKNVLNFLTNKLYLLICRMFKRWCTSTSTKQSTIKRTNINVG